MAESCCIALEALGEQPLLRQRRVCTSWYDLPVVRNLEEDIKGDSYHTQQLSAQP